jgi:hydrogenase maturation protein HypF
LREKLSEGTITTEVLIFKGIVQGVGFRPAVYRIASKMGMAGSVRNMGGLVQVIVTDTQERIDAFADAIVAGKPFISRIDSVERSVVDTVSFDSFTIEKSTATENEGVIFPADIAVCDECMAEFADPENHRYRHPFISCTNCGPRYSIMESIPYDRDTTTMDDFEMCAYCGCEYSDPLDRRYHAQTVSCHDCGPQPIWRGTRRHNGDGSFETVGTVPFVSTPRGQRGDLAGYSLRQRGRFLLSPPTSERTQKEPSPLCPKGTVPAVSFCVARCAATGFDSELTGALAVEAAGEALARGEVIAFKGTGGYYLTCDALSADAVATLRQVKRRERKPFAVMFRSADEAAEYCVIETQSERDALESEKRPIILLETNAQAKTLAAEVSNESRYTGAFLPSLALQYMLLEYASPLVMTSANHEGIPIITEDEDIFAMMKEEPGVAGTLYNERRIAVSLDDSVAAVPLPDGKVRPIRRSKGFAPAPVYIRSASALSARDMVFAAGGHLKAAFALTKGNYVYLSPYLGDMAYLSSEGLYKRRFEQMKEFFGIEPSTFVCDLHPRYFPTLFTENLIGKSGLESGKRPIYVQHHHAHIASVMAEHGLYGPVIGVAFDGVGYGEDGAVWGGEILICERDRYERFSHLKYVDLPGGDEAMREGWKAAVAHTVAFGSEAETKGDGSFLSCSLDSAGRTFTIDISEAIRFSKKYGVLEEACGVDIVEKMVKQKTGTVKCSSMGRLFDAVSSLLGIKNINHYEGECAIMLENFACAATRGENGGHSAGGSPLDRDVRKKEAERIARGFHLDVAETILAECLAASASTGKKNVREVALSGGVFQNRLLLRETVKRLQDNGFVVYLNESVPTNDGGIALGQAYLAMLKL